MASILSFNQISRHYNSGVLLLTFIVLWPYFGSYGEVYFRVSNALLLLTCLTFLDWPHLKKFAGFIFVLLSLAIIGQIIYAIDLLAIRELNRIAFLIAGYYIGRNFVVAFPSFKLALFILIIHFFSIAFHPSVPFLSDYFAAAPTMDHSYHYFRSIIPGGMPAASGYIMSIMIIWSYINLRKGEINTPQFLLTMFAIFFLVVVTQSRLPLALSVFFAISLPLIVGLKIKKVIFGYFILIIVFIISYSLLSNIQDTLAIDPRLYNFDTLQYRKNSLLGSFDIIGDEFFRIFPGCLFVRDCHFNGSWNSVTTDGAIPYVILNWGLPVTLLVFGYLYCLSVVHLYYLKLPMIFVVTVFSILSFLDPIFLDPKIGLLLAITLGFLSGDKLNAHGK